MYTVPGRSVSAAWQSLTIFFFALYNKLPNLNCSGSNVGVIRSVQTAPSALININREL